MTAVRVAEADPMEARLLAWAAYRSAGGSADGYPTTNVLHSSWSPPAPGQRPSMRVSAPGCERERALDAKIGELSVRLRDTLYVVYVKRMGAKEQALALGCQPATVRARVQEAKTLLMRAQ